MNWTSKIFANHLGNWLCVTCFDQEVGLAHLQGPFQPELFCDPVLWASLLMVMSIVYVVPIAFTQWIMCNNLYFVEVVFLYYFLKENSLLNLFVSLAVFLISSVTWYLLYLLICVIPHIVNKLLLPCYVFFFFKKWCHLAFQIFFLKSVFKS